MRPFAAQGLFHAMEKYSADFPRNGNFFSSAWKNARSAPWAACLLIFVLAALVRCAYLAEMAPPPSFRMLAP